MKITVEFGTENAAFSEDFEGEIRYVLFQARRKIMEQLERPDCLCDAPESADKILDHNGNTIGRVEVDGGGNGE